MAASKLFGGYRRGHAGRPHAQEARIWSTKPQRGRFREGLHLCVSHSRQRARVVNNNPRTCARQVTDPHLDAKVFPCPYGTGSVRSGATTIQPQRVCRNRLLSLQSFFRRSSRYAFWNLDIMLKRKLFFPTCSEDSFITSRWQPPRTTDSPKSSDRSSRRTFLRAARGGRRRVCCVCFCAFMHARREGPEPGVGFDL